MFSTKNLTAATHQERKKPMKVAMLTLPVLGAEGDLPILQVDIFPGLG
jgi:hypothetical protein